MIQSIHKGSGFRGVLNYITRKEGAELLGGTMGGRDARELAAEFRGVRELRPDVNRAVFHVSLSAAEGERLTDAQWLDCAAEYTQRMGFGRSPYVVVRHSDTGIDHVHIVASRIGVDGRLVSDTNDFRRGQPVLRDLEIRHDLERVANSWETGAKQYSRGEIEAIKADQPALRDRVRAEVRNDMKTADSWEDLEARLEAKGYRLEAATRGGGLMVVDVERPRERV